MPTIATLLIFSFAVLGLLVSPGPNMALVISHGIANGPRGGVAVASGILVADLLLTIFVVIGVAGLFAASPYSFAALRVCGTVYFIWLGYKAWQSSTAALPGRTHCSTRWSAVRLAIATSLLNPKALLFFLVFLPQFVDPDRGQVATQLVILGVVLSALAFAFHATLAVASASAGSWICTRAGTTRWLGRLQAVVFFALALRLMVLEIN